MSPLNWRWSICPGHRFSACQHQRQSCSERGWARPAMRLHEKPELEPHSRAIAMPRREKEQQPALACGPALSCELCGRAVPGDDCGMRAVWFACEHHRLGCCREESLALSPKRWTSSAQRRISRVFAPDVRRGESWSLYFTLSLSFQALPPARSTSLGLSLSR